MDLYVILGLQHGASDADIKRAYRRLAREHHPDANPDADAEMRMRRINEAWETLRDAQRRQAYDRALPRPVRTVVRPTRRPPPPRSPMERRDTSWFAQEDAPREPPRPGR